eukprot:TRINITY_DN42853_c0_g1_i1.p1 TRINITY_DN42853_c0_g1~~TRINITY_DN42853_c0_g1_i1.p1  ORF type:complete len:202 (+),score=17.06 TRINITY_DN42853_c0_g1_i1:30-635(+)
MATWTAGTLARDFVFLLHDALTAPLDYDTLHAVLIERRRKRLLDCYGICVHAMLLLLEELPAHSTNLFSRFAASTPVLSNITLMGRVFGKKSSNTPSSELRSIVLLPCAIQVLDVALYTMLYSCVSKLFEGCLPTCMVAGVPNAQALETAHALHLVTEKALDMMSRGGIAQMDIATYYDELTMVLIEGFLFNESHDVAMHR